MRCSRFTKSIFGLFSWVLLFALPGVAAEGANNADVLVAGSNVPGQMTPGSTASVRIRVRNTGTTTWSAGALYRLGATGANGVTWKGFPCGGYAVSATNARVFLCSNVPPGGTYDFNFQISVPSSAGTHRLGVRMVRDGVEWFGTSHAFSISVSGGSSNNAAFDDAGSQVPSSMTPGSRASVRIRVRNTGSTTWSAGALYRLGATGGNQVSWTGFSCGGYARSLTNARVFLCNNVPPGGTHDFNFQITAPSSPGTYRLSARMVRDGVEWFGPSYTKSITVGGSTGLPDVVVDSVSVIPSNPSNGQAVSFQAVVRNTGSAPTPNGVVIGVGYRIDGSQKTWGVVSGPLAPNATVTVGTQGGTWTATAGTHTLVAVADDVNRFRESNENNNGRSRTFTVGGSTGLPDVVVDSVSVIPSSPSNGQAVSFQAVVRNAGSAPTPNGVVIGVGYRIDGSQKTWGVVNGPLAPGARVTVGTQGGTWRATAGNHTLTAVADDVNRFRESNENNNGRSKSFSVSGGGSGVCPPGTFDIGDYILGDNSRLRVHVRNTNGETEDFGYLPGVFVAGVQQQFFIKNNSGENWEEFGLDSNYVYRYRDTTWTDVCTNPTAEAYYAVVDNNRTSFAKWAPRCMREGQTWVSDVGSRVIAHFEKINNCAVCDATHDGPTRQRTTLVRHHPTYETRWGYVVPDVIEIYGASTTDRFFYAKKYGLVGFEGPDPRGGEFKMGAYDIDEDVGGPPRRVPLCGDDTPPGFTGLSGFGPLVDYCFDERRVAVQGIAPNSAPAKRLVGRLQGNAESISDLGGNNPGAVQLDGDTARVVVQESEALRLRRGVQVEALIYRESNDSEDGIVSRWYGEDQWLLTLYPEGAGKLIFSVRLEDGTYRTVSYRLPRENYLKTWVHVAASYDVERGLRLYWNGSRVAAAKSGGKRLAPSSQPIRVGDSGNTWSRFHGRVDEVKVSAPAARFEPRLLKRRPKRRPIHPPRLQQKLKLGTNRR